MAEDTLASGAASAENPGAGANDGAAAAAAAAKAADHSGAGKQPDPAVAAADKAAAEAAAKAGKGAGDAGKANDGKAADDAGPWGNDWREKLAGSDAKKLDMLKRFASPDALLAAQVEAQRKISEGLKPKAKPGAKATDAEWAAWRKDQGSPETVDDYVKAIELPDKRVIGDDDKPIVAAFAERAVKRGIAPADMAELVDEYYGIQEEMQAQQADKDAAFKKEAETALRKEWGGDMAANFNAMRPYFESVDPDIFGNLMGGRMADGTKIGNHPGLLKFFVNKAVAENPMATLMPSANSGIESIETEIKGMEKRMGDDRVAWHKDTAAQERYRKLIDARDAVKSKQSA